MLPMTEKRRKMKQLAKRKNKLTSMDPDESLQISDWRCALTNAPVFDTKKGDTKYWRISIDHIIPRSEAGNTSVSVTAIENIQIVSHIMNMIKQSFANEEVIEWWGRFRENQMKP
ncbi:hypothetical protein G6F56_000212 [Rhizopus delemar]|nr:hypothetical protein G6F56_000212 [Rhizopus delemar]